MAQDVFTAEELAERWQCHLATVYRLLQSKKLKGFKLGRGVRISRAEVERYERGE